LGKTAWTRGGGRQLLLVQLQGLYIPSLTVKYLLSFVLECLFLPLQAEDAGPDFLFSLPGAVQLAVGFFDLRVEFRLLCVTDG
jgi:hypothetical protein